MAFGRNSILVKGYECRKELKTDEAITPGHLLERGGTHDVQKHSTAGGFAVPMFALENDLVGEDIDDAYADNEAVQVAYCSPGTEIYAIIADGNTITAGDKLISAGDGTLTEQSSELDSAVVAVATEAVTTSGATARIIVEVV